MFKLLQINLNHSLTSHNALLGMIKDGGIDILCTQDPYLSGGSPIDWDRNFRVFSSAAGNSQIIILNPDIIAHFVFSSFSTVFIDIHFRKYSFKLASVYFRPHMDITSQLLELEEFNFGMGDYLLLGDFNGHGINWGYQSTDFRGEMLENFIITNNFVLLNDTSQGPSFFSTNGVGNPDLSICTSSLYNSSPIWKILDFESFSDHRYITIEFSHEASNDSNFFFKTKYPLGKFKSFIKPQLSLLHNKLKQVMDTASLENNFVALSNAVSSAAFKTVRKKRKTTL